MNESIDLGLALRPRAAEICLTLESIVLGEGFSRLSLTDLAERLSCSKRTLYEIAPSRNALVLKLLATFFARIRHDAAHAARVENTYTEALHVYLHTGVRAAARLSQETVTDIHRWEPALNLWQEHIRLRVQGLCELLEKGIEARAFRRVKTVLVAELVFASLSRLREPDFHTTTGITVSEAFQEYYAMLIAALAPGQ